MQERRDAILRIYPLRARPRHWYPPGVARAGPSPFSSLRAAAPAPRDLKALFVTHIHLDHAGSAGHFAREGVPVFVHPRGAPHLVEPSRLIAGSRAVHGSRYGEFYGDPLPIAAEMVRAVEHGATVMIGGLRWMPVARLVRAQFFSLREKEFVEAAIAVGVSPFTIILRHIVPNLLGIVVVYATLLIPGLIMAESFISFLGLGVQEPMTSLGALIQAGSKQMLYGAWWQIAFPLFFFLATLFAFTFVGDGLRDALDPKDR